MVTRRSDGLSCNEPGGNHQTWQVEDDFDNASCDAVINFNVLGKPSPPPGAQVLGFVSGCLRRRARWRPRGGDGLSGLAARTTLGRWIQASALPSERTIEFQEVSRVCQLNPTAGLRRARTAVSSLFSVTTARGRLQLENAGEDADRLSVPIVVGLNSMLSTFAYLLSDELQTQVLVDGQ